jgi:PAS domain S-box-containing protein
VNRLEARDWLQALFEETPMAIGFSRDGIMLDANAAYVHLFGYDSVAELRGRSVLEQVATSHRAHIVQMITQRARGAALPERYESRGLRKDGTEFPFDITTTRVTLEDGPLTIAFISDTTERAMALDAMRASEEKFRTLSDAAFEGVFIHTGGKIILANEAGAEMFGSDASSLVGTSLLDHASPESRATVAENVRRGVTEPYDAVGLRKDGTSFIAELRGRSLALQGASARVTIIRDVTELRRVEAEQRALAERVRHAQKLESLGVLAGGVAHDFNNLLTVIANGVALAKRDSAAGRALDVHLDTIALASERAADLCRQMLAYAGKAAFAHEAVDLSALVNEMSSMLEVSVDKKAALVRELGRELPLVLGDATQIRQVVMNLVINAAEAIGGARGTVRVSTGAATYDADALARSVAGGDPRPGPYVHIEVRDDGIGMDPKTLAQMFDPFFTTKFMGRGLGMAAVLGIVRGHAGAIEVESSPGEGTRIRVCFPASAEARLGESSIPANEPEGTGVVLVVDDERSIRASTGMLLEGFGYEVLTAADGVEAVEVFGAESARIGAVLLDLTMPRMSGVEALAEIRRMAPDVPIVLTSGYGDAALETSRTGARPALAPDAVLAKPYGSDELLTTLRRIMQRAR